MPPFFEDPRVHPSQIQPIALTTPTEVINAAFIRSREENTDPLWSFEIGVNKESRRAPLPKTAPQADGALTSLALYNLAEPPCDTEVYGAHLPHDIDPAEWLELWVEQRPMTVLARRHTPTISGIVGDLVVMWETDGKTWMGRMFALKSGPRMLVVWCRTAAPDYPHVAESMLVNFSTLRFLDDSTGPLAEIIRWVESDWPRPWRTAIPTSWEIKQGPANEKSATFQAALMIPQPGGEPAIAGKLTQALISPSQAARVDDVIEAFRRPLTDAGAVVGNMMPIAERKPAAALGAWHAHSDGQINGLVADVRCRVRQYPDLWVAGMMVSLPRKQAPDVWMRCKRLLDIAIDTTELR
jgi:hypothetical protein